MRWAKVGEIPELLGEFPELGGVVAAPHKEADYAEFGTRFLSGLIDVLVLIVPTFVGSLIVPV